jgi:amidase
VLIGGDRRTPQYSAISEIYPPVKCHRRDGPGGTRRQKINCRRGCRKRWARARRFLDACTRGRAFERRLWKVAAGVGYAGHEPACSAPCCILPFHMCRITVALTLFLPAVLGAQPIVPTNYYRTFSHTNPVLRRIKPGEVVMTQTLDSSGRDFHGNVRHPESGNPLTGPFFIEGADPGDAILVHLRRVRLNRDWGYSGYQLGLYALLPEFIRDLYSPNYKPDLALPGRSNLVRWEIDLAQNIVRLRDPASTAIKMEFPAIPMLGCIGVAAPGDFAPTSGPAGSYGGNMDYNRVREGATVILPVYHPGALLYVGDGHALMGDGEPTGNGIEASMDVEFAVDVAKKIRLDGPRLENAESIISIGSQPEFVSSLDRALAMATTDMVKWLSSEYKLEPWAAHLLVAFQGQYDVVTVSGSMALRIPKKYLPAK